MNTKRNNALKLFIKENLNKGVDINTRIKSKGAFLRIFFKYKVMRNTRNNIGTGTFDQTIYQNDPKQILTGNQNTLTPSGTYIAVWQIKEYLLANGGEIVTSGFKHEIRDQKYISHGKRYCWFEYLDKPNRRLSLIM